MHRRLIGGRYFARWVSVHWCGQCPERQATPMNISFVLNSQEIQADVLPRLTLADFLRDEAGLTGTHLGCEHGACGSCTVMVDGEAVRSCLILAVQADGSE